MKTNTAKNAIIAATTLAISLSLVIDAFAGCGDEVYPPLAGQNCASKGTTPGGVACSTGTEGKCPGGPTETQYDGCTDCKSGGSGCRAYTQVDCPDVNDCVFRVRVGTCISWPACIPQYGNWGADQTLHGGNTCVQ